MGSFVLAGCFASGQAVPPADEEQSLERRARNALQFAEEQLRQTVEERTPEAGYPRSVEGKTWQTVGASDWTSGFFPGLLWQMYAYTGVPYWKQQAQAWTAGLEGQKTNTGTHDVGFMLFNSFGQGYCLTGDSSYADVTRQAARSLASRYDTDVGATKSWNWPEGDFPVIVDNMMNLELLFWAARNGGSERLRKMAIQHARTTIQNHIRPDGSTFHLVNFDPQTGEVQRKQTVQGAADTSAWARGQAWTLYGFTMAYRETHEPRFLQTAQRVADWYVAHLPENGVPYWDFDAPGIPNAPRDASAAAIAASGLLELSQFARTEEARRRYYSAAKRTLRTLTQPPYLARESDSPSILLHSVGNHPGGSEIDVPLVYADYYFVEALRRYLQLQEEGDRMSLAPCEMREGLDAQ